LKSTVLVIGSSPTNISHLGVDIVEQVAQAKVHVSEAAYRVVVLEFHPKTAPAELEWLKQRLKLQPETQFILLAKSGCNEQLIEAVQTGRVFQVIDDLVQLEPALSDAIEKTSRDRQDEDLLRMIHEQSDKLSLLSAELEDRVEKRSRSLANSKSKLIETNVRAELLHAMLLRLLTANSVLEMEQALSESLQPTMGFASLRIVFAAQTSLESVADHVYQVPLPLSSKRPALLLFSRPVHRSFAKNETAFLDKVAEATGLALDRLLTLNDLEHLKKQWEATFDAISDPLCLTSVNFKILRVNKAFTLWTHKTYSEVVGRDPFELAFGEPTSGHPDLSADRFKIMKVQNAAESPLTFEVSGELLQLRPEPIRWILFRDVTESKMLEHQLLESAKMAELGTIGSSIAHELNNPVGGMLSFLQLIKMELKPKDPHYADIAEMEETTRRCKDIIENLLGFARRQTTLDATLFDLKPMLNQLIKLTDLQNRSLGIQTELICTEEQIPFKGNVHQLQQALHHLLKNASEALQERMKREPDFDAKLQVTFKVQAAKYILTIIDNGLGIDDKNLRYIFNPLFSTKNTQTNTGLGLTMAFKIIREHGGELEISSQPKVGTSAKISLLRPDLESPGRLFDGKI
jgi:signal transduction histidine kinase